MSETHQKRAIGWFLVLHEQPLNQALRNALPATGPEAAPATAETEETDQPTLYDTALSADEGLWTRSGWAGRG